MTGTPDNYEKLELLIIALGHLPDGKGKYLHFRDEDHRHTGDETILYSPEILQALALGKYRNFIGESPIETNEMAAGRTNIAELKKYGITLRYADARFSAAIKKIDEKHGPATAQLASEHYGIFLEMMYNHGQLTTAESREAFVRSIDAQDPSIALEPATVDAIVNAYDNVSDVIFKNSGDTALNVRSIKNMKRMHEDGTFDPAFNTAIGQGANHQNDELDRSADLDDAMNFPGYNISIIGTDDGNGAHVPDENELLQRIRRDPVTHRAKVDDPPEFIVLQSTGEIIENRHPDQRVPSLEQLYAQARIIRTQATAQTRPTQPVQPEQPPATTPTTTPPVAAAPTPTSAKTDEGFKLENLPWWTIIGGGLGAWMASGIGNGFFNIISMVIGAFLGSALLSFMDKKGEEEAPEVASQQATAQNSTVRSLNQLAISRSLSAGPAFARVDSVELPVTEADPGELLDSPRTERIASVATLAIQ